MTTLRDRTTAAFEAAYAGPVRTAVERAGLDPQVRAGFERLRDAAEWIDYRRAPDPYPLAVGPARARFHLRNRVEYHRVSTLVGEREVLSDFLARLRPDDVVWDVGANIGTHACLAADVVTDGTVVAFEPHPGNFGDLEANVALNDLSNVRTRRQGLGDEPSTGDLVLTGRGPGHGTHSLVAVDDGVGAIEVPIERGDDLIADGLPSPTVAKIDVQGAELDVLRGLDGALSGDDFRHVLCEVHPPTATAAAVRDRLEGYGFETEAFTEAGDGVFRGGVEFVRATREP